MICLALAAPFSVLTVMTRAYESSVVALVDTAYSAAGETRARPAKYPACHQPFMASAKTQTTRRSRLLDKRAIARQMMVGMRASGTNETTSGTIRPFARSVGRTLSAMSAQTPSMASQSNAETSR